MSNILVVVYSVAEVTLPVGRTPVLDAAFKTRDIEDGSFAGRLEAFGRALQQAEEKAGTVMRPAVWSAQAG